MASDGEQLILRGELVGHSNWVTSIVTTPEYPDMVLSSSRDGSLIVWEVNGGDDEYGRARTSLTGHNGVVQDVAISSDGNFALSGSWDKTMRLWDLNAGVTTKRFTGHTKDVMSVAFSANNRQIVSASRDKTIKLWNTVGVCKYTLDNDGHTDWVSCVRFSPRVNIPMVVSAGWDKKVNIWNLTTCSRRGTLYGHTGPVNTVTVAPDASLCASGGKDGTAMLWDLTEVKHLYSLAGTDEITNLCFSPNRYWLCGATTAGVKIWNLMTKTQVYELQPPYSDAKCISLAWSADGYTLYAGYTDGVIRVWQVSA